MNPFSFGTNSHNISKITFSQNMKPNQVKPIFFFLQKLNRFQNKIPTRFGDCSQQISHVSNLRPLQNLVSTFSTRFLITGPSDVTGHKSVFSISKNPFHINCFSSQLVQFLSQMKTMFFLPTRKIPFATEYALNSTSFNPFRLIHRIPFSNEKKKIPFSLIHKNPLCHIREIPFSN